MSLRVANCCSMLRTRHLPLWRLRVNNGEGVYNHYQQFQRQNIFRRSIQNLASPSHPKPTEKIIYGVEEEAEVEDLDISNAAGGAAAAAASASAAVGKEVTSDSLSSGSVNTTNRVSPSQKQASFIDKTISSTLSTSAIQGSSTSPFVDGTKGISSAVMHHRQQKSRSHSEPPCGTNQKELDHQFPQLRLNHLAPNFHALSSHGPLELYEYLSTPITSDSPGKNNLEGQPRARGGEQEEGHWLIFFSHPMDFTPVCTTEIASMVRLQDEFAKRGAKLLGLSIGSVEEHRRWMADVRGIVENGGLRPSTVGQMVSGKVNQVGIGEEEPLVVHSVSENESVSPFGGSNTSVSEGNVSSNSRTRIGGVGALDEEKELGIEDVVGSGSIGITDTATNQSLSKSRGEKGEGNVEKENLLRFPIIADEDGFVAQLYGMLEDSNGEKAADPHRSEHLRTVRSLFIIDPQKRIRLMTSYPHTTGRNAAEILRVLDALQRSDREGVLTQEGWTVGDEVIIPPEMSKEDAEKRFGKGGVRTVNEYLRFGQPVLT